MPTTSPKTYSLGIDIGGTKMLAVLFDGSKVIDEYTLATPKDTLEHFLIMMNALVEPLLEKAKKNKAQISGIGLGIPGVHDYSARKILHSPNIEILNNIKLAALLEDKLNLPVFMDNDANCFVRAEAMIGSAKKFLNIFGLIIGTGIGGGWFINGDVYKGAHGGAGEPGETIVNYHEALGLEEAYHKLFQNNVKNSSEEAYRGDPLAQKAFEEWSNLLGIALSNIINIIDPEVIVIGGGGVGAGDLFLNQAKITMQQHIESPLSKKIKVLRSKLGTNAGAIGAALLVKFPSREG